MITSLNLIGCLIEMLFHCTQFKVTVSGIQMGKKLHDMKFCGLGSIDSDIDVGHDTGTDTTYNKV